MKLRDYQLEISDAVFDYLFTKEGNPVVASPGGTGKSLTMNHIIKRLVTEWPGTKVLSLVHDAKVIAQNCDSMLKYWPHAPVGVYSAGLKMRDTHQPIIYAGIQSIAKRAADFGEVHIVIIDECDLVSPKE
jgi:DNA repair protein RadD